jgi:hypothetical protein
VRKALRSQFHTLLYRARQRKSLRVFALGQRLRHFADHVTQKAGVANGERVRRWVQEKQAGWYAVLADESREMPGAMPLSGSPCSRKLRAFAIGVFFDSSYPSCGRLSRPQTPTPSPPPPEVLGKFRWGFPCLLPLPFAPFGRFPVFSM